jgi:hypothetical protein
MMPALYILTPLFLITFVAIIIIRFQYFNLHKNTDSIHINFIAELNLDVTHP